MVAAINKATDGGSHIVLVLVANQNIFGYGYSIQIQPLTDLVSLECMRDSLGTLSA